MRRLQSIFTFAKAFSISTGIILSLLFIYLIFSVSVLFDDPSVWPDEAIYGDISYNLLTKNQVGTELWNGVVKGFENYYLALPPFYFYISAFWFKLFGFSIITQRLLSVSLGAGAIVIFYFLIKRLLNSKTNFIPWFMTLLLTTDPTFLQRVRIARPEILVIVLYLLSLFAFVKAYSENSISRKNLLLFTSGFISGLSLITHLASVGFTLSLLIFLIFSQRTFQNLKYLIYFAVGIILPLIAWVIFLYPNYSLLVEQLNLVQLSRDYTVPWYINVYYFTYPYKLNFFIYIFTTISFIFFSFRQKNPFYSLISYFLVLSWIFATIGEIFWYIIYPIIFSYLALAILLEKYLLNNQTSFKLITTNFKTTWISSWMKIFRTRYVRTNTISRVKLKYTRGVSSWSFIVSLTLISICLFLLYSNVSYYKSKIDTYRYSNEYQTFLNQIKESVPPGKVVYLSTIPDAYYAFEKGRNRLYAFPALFSDLDSFENTLNQTDYLIFNNAYIPNPRAVEYLDRYMGENTKNIKEITSPYKLFIVELKDIKDRKAIPK